VLDTSPDNPDAGISRQSSSSATALAPHASAAIPSALAISQLADQSPSQPQTIQSTTPPMLAKQSVKRLQSETVKAQTDVAAISDQLAPEFRVAAQRSGASQHSFRNPALEPGPSPSTRNSKINEAPRHRLNSDVFADTSSSNTPVSSSDTSSIPGSTLSSQPKDRSSQSNNSSENQSDSSQQKDSTAAVAPLGNTQPVTPQAAATQAVATMTTTVLVQPVVNQTAETATIPQKSARQPFSDQASAAPNTAVAQRDFPQTSTIGPVQAAQIVSRAAQSEMRIGLNTPSFGSVEVHTVVRANDVGLLIGSERGDLKSLLSSELPAIAGNLQQHDLRLNQVSFHQQGFGFSSQTPSGGGSQSRYFAGKAKGSAPLSNNLSHHDAGTPAEATPAPRSARLSILA
ncbi:MAG TPA: flagellar hook-length control protein FliK, partial [Candidatus Sulfotelmatobacter sp.]|nr:flagellar hook-length control protein FliK [Candidatus Sulfotelmatobacter sp.]